MRRASRWLASVTSGLTSQPEPIPVTHARSDQDSRWSRSACGLSGRFYRLTFLAKFTDTPTCPDCAAMLTRGTHDHI